MQEFTTNTNAVADALSKWLTIKLMAARNSANTIKRCMDLVTQHNIDKVRLKRNPRHGQDNRDNNRNDNLLAAAVSDRDDGMERPGNNRARATSSRPSTSRGATRRCLPGGNNPRRIHLAPSPAPTPTSTTTSQGIEDGMIPTIEVTVGSISATTIDNQTILSTEKCASRLRLTRRHNGR